MLNSPVLDTAIGLIFIFLLYSLLATSINEAIATLFGLRARMLKKGIVHGMLSNSKHEGWIVTSAFKKSWKTSKEFVFILIGYKPKVKGKLGDAFYNHPIIRNYGATNRLSTPSYLSKENFSDVLIEVLKQYGEEHKVNIQSFITANYPDSVDFNTAPAITKIYYLVQYLKSVDDIQLIEEFKKNNIHIDKETLQILSLYLQKSELNIKCFTTYIETWFDDTMDRISGWYKKQVQYILFTIGITIAITFNVDVLAIAGKLSTDKDARDKLVEMAIKESEHLKEDLRVKRDAAGHTADSASIEKLENEIAKIKSDLNNEIKDANNLLAVGWDDYGFKKDSVCVSNKYKKEIAGLEAKARINTPKPPKTIKDTAFYYNQKAILALYDKHWFKLKVTHILRNSPRGRKPLGFLIFAFAVCLGAPFWFDLLQKVVRVRTALKKEETPNVPVKVTVK